MDYRENISRQDAEIAKKMIINKTIKETLRLLSRHCGKKQ